MKNFYVVAYLSGVADSFFGGKPRKLHVHSYVANSSAEEKQALKERDYRLLKAEVMMEVRGQLDKEKTAALLKEEEEALPERTTG